MQPGYWFQMNITGLCTSFGLFFISVVAFTSHGTGFVVGGGAQNLYRPHLKSSYRIHSRY